MAGTELPEPDLPDVFDPEDYKNSWDDPVGGVTWGGTAIVVGIGYQIIETGIKGVVPPSVKALNTGIHAVIAYGTAESYSPKLNETDFVSMAFTAIGGFFGGPVGAYLGAGAAWGLGQIHTRDMTGITIYGAEGYYPDDLCFPASTPISISPTETRPISDIRVGDTVLAFDPAADLGRGALVPRKVVRLYRNTTDEWVKLTWAEGGEAKELIATPGHHFLDQFGGFPTIEEMLENGVATVIPASGELTEVTAERITYSAETAHLFEQAQAVGMIAGNTALMRGKTASVRVWA